MTIKIDDNMPSGSFTIMVNGLFLPGASLAFSLNIIKDLDGLIISVK